MEADYGLYNGANNLIQLKKTNYFLFLFLLFIIFTGDAQLFALVLDAVQLEKFLLCFFFLF